MGCTTARQVIGYEEVKLLLLLLQLSSNGVKI